ncbi:Uncharacterized protein APZ42_024975 [Daphnia magna]|uniref:Uncharacterized protein n=1 Tax=Daphnia magna TaxID=35525 RepID=A0A164TKK1_9CRUS|nr:Uncharacterized protein APZ42_024975 [Daphnia magna]
MGSVNRPIHFPLKYPAGSILELETPTGSDKDERSLIHLAGESDIDFSMHIMAELTLGSNSLSAFWRHHNSPPLPPRSTNVQSGGTPAAYNTINIYRSMRAFCVPIFCPPTRSLSTCQGVRRLVARPLPHSLHVNLFCLPKRPL